MFAAGIVTGALIVAGTIVAAPSKADVFDDAQVYAVGICGALNDSPTVATVVGIGLVLMEEGYTGEQAGEIMAIAVVSRCPEHEPVLYRFAQIFGEGETA